MMPILSSTREAEALKPALIRVEMWGIVVLAPAEVNSRMADSCVDVFCHALTCIGLHWWLETGGPCGLLHGPICRPNATSRAK